MGTPQCTYPAPLAEPTDKRWEQCDGGPLVASPHGSFGVNQDVVVDLATGQAVVNLDLGASDLPAWNDRFEGPLGVEVVGWSGGNVLLKVTYASPAQSTPSTGGAWTITPAYVGVRCSALVSDVDTVTDVGNGACERIPHPMDVVAVERSS